MTKTVMTSFAAIKQTAASAHSVNVMRDSRETMPLKRTCSILSFTCFGVRTTVELCGIQKIIAQEDLGVHTYQSQGLILFIAVD